MNPFKYGDPVRGEFYFPRPELRKSLLNFIHGQINVTLIGPRRFGKTSFILDLLQVLHQENFSCVYVDVFNVTSHRDFLNQLVHAITQEQSFVKKTVSWLKSLPAQFKPALNWEPSEAGGNIRLSLMAHRLDDDQVKQMIAYTLEALGGLAKRSIIAFDEFQTIGQLEDGGWLEATLRSHMQLQKNVSFVFSGSRHGIIHAMFNSPARPFYRSCQIIDFPRFGPEFSRWIVERFKKAGIVCPLEQVDYLRGLVDDTPNYVQMACFHLVADEVEQITKDDIDGSLKRITSQNSYPYHTILNSLTPIQQRVLRLAACEGKEIFTQESLKRYEIKSAAHVSQALKSLVAKQIIDESTKKGVVIFDDPLFAIWLRNEFRK